MKLSPLKLSLLLVISLSQIILLFGFLSYKNLNILLGSWGKTASLNIYLKTDALEAEKKEIQKKIENLPFVETTQLINRRDAAEDFQKTLGSYAAGLLTIDEMIDLVPETIIVSLKSSLSIQEKTKQFEKINEQYKNMPGVEEISFGSEWLNRFSKFDQMIKSTGYFILIVLLLTMSFMSALMIRVMIDDMRSEIEVYQLIGATRWSIYKIFIKQILQTISLSAILSISAVTGLFFYLKDIYFKNDFTQFISSQLSFLSLIEISSFVLIFFLFMTLSSYFSILTTLKNMNQFSSE